MTVYIASYEVTVCCCASYLRLVNSLSYVGLRELSCACVLQDNIFTLDVEEHAVDEEALARAVFADNRSERNRRLERV